MQKNVLILAVILIIAFAAMAAPVMAAQSATITANPAKTITVTVNGGITNWALAQGLNTDATSVTLDVASNSPNWVVSVKDALDPDSVPTAKPDAGQMVDYNTATSVYGTLKLGSSLVIGGATSATQYTGATVTLTGSDQAIVTGANASTAAGTFTGTPVTIKQTVAITDSVLPTNHVYRIIVTMTGTTP
ncbi:hypothetical protein [Methanoregula sp.]|uniref:hypothetical protein n=1 Tax=Methanoregula sp. TaxID=2052170 RepID=UPI0025F9EE46|nr:hypothetical protein [Methanoregula sp.]